MTTKSTGRQYANVPNMAFIKVVAHFAFYSGNPFWTWKQQAAAFGRYIDIAKRLN